MAEVESPVVLDAFRLKFIFPDRIDPGCGPEGRHVANVGFSSGIHATRGHKPVEVALPCGGPMLKENCGGRQRARQGHVTIV